MERVGQDEKAYHFKCPECGYKAIAPKDIVTIRGKLRRDKPKKKQLTTSMDVMNALMNQGK